MGPKLQIKENETLRFGISSSNSSLIEKGVLFTTRDGEAKKDEKDFYTIENGINKPFLFTNSTSISLGFKDDVEEEPVTRAALGISRDRRPEPANKPSPQGGREIASNDQAGATQAIETRSRSVSMGLLSRSTRERTP